MAKLKVEIVNQTNKQNTKEQMEKKMKKFFLLGRVYSDAFSHSIYTGLWKPASIANLCSDYFSTHYSESSKVNIFLLSGAMGQWDWYKYSRTAKGPMSGVSLLGLNLDSVMSSFGNFG